jgi:hypothetical protein
VLLHVGVDHEIEGVADQRDEPMVVSRIVFAIIRAMRAEPRFPNQ